MEDLIKMVGMVHEVKIVKKEGGGYRVTFDVTEQYAKECNQLFSMSRTDDQVAIVVGAVVGN